MKSTSGRTRRTGTAAIAENADPARAEAAIRRVVELSGGMDWLKPGASVVIKPALNSSHAFPFTASPASCAALVRMCLERGAKQVWVADETGFEHTMLKHWKTGHFAGFQKDHTIKSFKKTGIYDAVRSVGDELGAADRIHITTFREHGWRRHALSTSREESGGFALHNEWVKEQLKGAEKLGGGQARRRYLPRLFDRTPGGSKAGLHTFLEAIRNRIGRYGVRVVTVKPGFVETRMTAGLAGTPWMITADRAAEIILRRAQRGRETVYVPARWRYVMWVIRSIPSFLFKHLKV